MNKLASIEIVHNVEPIENADKIELISVLGWKCVVQKGAFQKYDKCVYIALDSIVPEVEPFIFLGEHNRIKTRKMRGVYSQGLAMPLNLFAIPNLSMLERGADITEVLGIKKYEKQIPINMQGLVKGAFPSFLRKTDEERVQNVPGILSRHADAECYITEKLDGTSVTYFINNGVFGVCSRNLELQDGSNIYWDMARKFGIEEALKSFTGRNLALQGEIIGPRIQNNPYELTENMFMAFSVFDIDKQAFGGLDDLMLSTLDKDVPMVPVVDAKFFIGSKTVDDIIKMAIGPSMLNLKSKREGLVVRGLIDLPDIETGRFSFKVINNEYAMEKGE